MSDPTNTAVEASREKPEAEVSAGADPEAVREVAEASEKERSSFRDRLFNRSETKSETPEDFASKAKVNNAFYDMFDAIVTTVAPKTAAILDILHGLKVFRQSGFSRSETGEYLKAEGKWTDTRTSL